MPEGPFGLPIFPFISGVDFALATGTIFGFELT